ncbi:hypothetical protein FRACYDRAFT_258384 [Fragilariopsis cylindrus CCMP1102]|uniref:Uncharacterized protein n=1 Tax=Fragilariopsis cylindrus CCMP1102 TaxID=635003 RepID=A0A1E7EIN7_9STRA|nr:hypothetical protein FRACYDRAFT_258384 [Fragilariopsis cylindrus CCMP1102]|eukprot:OEU05754.1 hypothetical protein FRACYDRAFT_258384 [Fragilariopsis cylindrus CCMP1102]
MIPRAPTKPPPPLCTDIFSKGACVRVDPCSTSKGGIGFVSAVHPEQRKVDVNYIENAIGISNSSPFITEARLHYHVYAPSDDTGTTRSGRLLQTLKEGKENKQPGWLRRDVKEALQLPSTPSGQLKSPERRLLSKIKDTSSALTPSKTKGFNMLSNHAHAWGKSKSTIQRCDTLANPLLTASRKQRTDAGKSIFTCEIKRKQVFTPLDFYKRYIRHNNPGEPYNDSDLRAAFELLSTEEKIPYGHCALSLQMKAANAPDDIGELLRTTNGSISWSLLSEKLRGDGVMVANANTIRSYVMSLPESVYQSTRIVPMLTSQTKTKRFDWACGFNILWYGAKLVAATVQVVLVQSDEKWFYSLVVRQKLKCVPFFGCQPVVHGVHHKNHIGKVLVFVMTAFMPTGNNFETGGQSFKLLCTRAGAMVEAVRDSYRRVYRDDGSYHYPQIAENLLRSAGDPYFKSMEITGSNEGTDKEPKFSLLKLFKEEGLPAMDALAQQLTVRTGKRIVMVKQWDNATPHMCKHLKKWMKKEFNNRGWELRNQPPNSPITNTKDSAMFPSMAKMLTAYQGLHNGSHYLQGEELWKGIQQVYKNYPLDTLSRAYMHHAQIANAIIECEGGDEFATASRSLHCGVRSVVHPVYENEQATEPCGVEIRECLTAVDVEAKLRYKKPVVTKEYQDALNVHNEDHLYNPGKHLSYNLLDMFVQEMDGNEFDYDYYEDAFNTMVEDEDWEVFSVASRDDEEFDYDDDEEEEPDADLICITEEMGESTNGYDPESTNGSDL